MINKASIKRLVAGALGTILLLISIPFTAAATHVSATDPLDFSDASASTLKLNAAELMQSALGISVSTEEAAYLNSLGFSLKYSEGLSAALITSVPSDDRITVTAASRSYTAQNGETVTWIPTKLKIEGESHAFAASGNAYEVVLTSLLKDKLYQATVEYEAVIELSASALSPWVDRAYEDGKSAVAAQDAYELAKKEYEKANQSYQNALADYEVAHAAYLKYQQELKKYNAELADYNDYLAKVEAYETALALHQAYLKALEQYNSEYAEYEKALAAFNTQKEAYDKYLSYLSELQTVTKKLTTLNTAFVRDSVGHRMYSTLMGDTVATVMDKKNELVMMAGASARDIENAGAATEILQSLLTEYSKLTDDIDRMNWYIANYQVLKDNFILLYSSLDNLGKNRAVQIKLNSEGKWERYAQFVGQLYIISTGLDDSETFDSGWIFAKTFRIYDLIEECQRVVDDNSASPVGVKLPEKVDEVEKPILPVPPSKPAAVSEPVKTWEEELLSPGDAPSEVAEPKKPEKSDYVSEMPKAPELSAELAALSQLVRDGALTKREITVGDTSLSFSSEFETTLFLESHPAVTFYDHEGKKILYSVVVDKGDRVEYVGATPTREPDAEFTYSFVGWVNAAGESAKLESIQENTAVYAAYSKTLREYSVVWKVAGQTVSESYTYGQLPVYTGSTDYSDSEYVYYFNGWSPAVSTVTGNAEYTAQYTRLAFADIKYSVHFKVGETEYMKTFTHGQTPVFEDFDKDYFSGGYRYVFVGWTPEVSPVYGEVTYTARFDKTLVLPAGENGESAADMTVTGTTHTVITDKTSVEASYAVGEALKAGTQLVLRLGDAKLTLGSSVLKSMTAAARFAVTPKGNGAWELRITDASGQSLALGGELLVELPVTDADAAGGQLGAKVNGKPAALTVQGSTAFLRVSEIGTLELLPYYTVDVKTTGNGSIALGKERFEAGESVALELHLENGWTVGRLLYSIDGGALQPLELTDGKFVMPQGNVSISAEFVEAEYTVSFVVNGVTLSSQKYRYGDSVAEPNMAELLIITEGDRTLTFSGWDSPLSAVTGDKVYTAVYKEGSVAHKDTTYVSKYNSDKLFTIVLPTVAGVAVLGLAALIARRIYKKKKNTTSADK